MAAVMNNLSCNGCGASLAYAAGQQALKCDFCNAITEIPRPELAVNNIADLLIPLTVEQRALEHAVYGYMAGGHYTPDDLVEHAVLTKVERFYAPAYLFTGEYEAQWTASFGYDRRETYTEYETRYENGHTRKVPVSKSRTVTDWRPVNGSDTGKFAVIGYSGHGLPSDVTPLIERTGGGGNVTDFDVSFVTGLETQPFAISERDTYSQRALPQINQVIETSVMRHAQGDRQRDWHWTSRIDKDGHSVLVPLCHVVFEYEGKSYNVWTDGTDVGKLVGDTLPMDQKRKRIVYFGFAPAAATTTVLLLSGLMSEGHGLLAALSSGTLIATASAWGYGFLRRHLILRYSSSLRQSLLAQRTAAQSNLAGLSEDVASELAASYEPVKKPSILEPVRDKRILITTSVVLSLAIVGMTFWKSRPNSDSEQLPAAVPVAELQQPVPALTTRLVEPPAAMTAPVETPAAPTTDSASNAATEAPMPAVSTAAPSSEPAVKQVAPVEATAEQKNQLLLDMLQSANNRNWNSVESDVSKLKQFSQAIAGDRAQSKAANDEGLKSLRQKDYAEAIAAFSRAARSDASNIEARNNLGFAYLQSGDTASAINILTDLLVVAPERTTAWANLSEALALSDKAGAADASLRLGIHFSGNRARTLEYLNRAAQTRATDKFGEAVSRVMRDISSIP